MSRQQLRMLSIAISAIQLVGCVHTYPMIMTARDSGKTYPADQRLNIHGLVTVTVNIDGESYSGPYSLGGPEVFGIIRRFGVDPSSAGGNQLSRSARLIGTAVLSSSSGHSIRCEYANLPHGFHSAAICLDDADRVYDIKE